MLPFHRGVVQRCTWICLFAFTIIATGCKQSENIYPVSGTIVFEDGSPVMFGDIEFQASQELINARGKIQRDGSFTVGTRSKSDGAILGEHKVVIVQTVTNHFNLDVVHDHGHTVDPLYSSYQTTDLTVEVKPEKNQLNLVVKKRPE